MEPVAPADRALPKPDELVTIVTGEAAAERLMLPTGTKAGETPGVFWTEYSLKSASNGKEAKVLVTCVMAVARAVDVVVVGVVVG